MCLKKLSAYKYSHKLHGLDNNTTNAAKARKLSDVLLRNAICVSVYSVSITAERSKLNGIPTIAAYPHTATMTSIEANALRLIPPKIIVNKA